MGCLNQCLHGEWLDAEEKADEEAEGSKPEAEEGNGEGDAAMEGDGIPAEPPAPPRFLQYVAASPGQVCQCTSISPVSP